MESVMLVRFGRYEGLCSRSLGALKQGILEPGQRVFCDPNLAQDSALLYSDAAEKSRSKGLNVSSTFRLQICDIENGKTKEKVVCSVELP